MPSELGWSSISLNCPKQIDPNNKHTTTITFIKVLPKIVAVSVTACYVNDRLFNSGARPNAELAILNQKAGH